MAMPGVEAKERLNAFYALSNTLACAFGEKGAPLPQALRDDLIAAYLAAR